MKILNFGSMCQILLISRGLQGHSLLNTLSSLYLYALNQMKHYFFVVCQTPAKRLHISVKHRVGRKFFTVKPLSTLQLNAFPCLI